jgi:histidine triad (HIT) family protein
MTLFEKIIARQIPADIVYEDEDTLAFKDIAPQAPVHVLVVPKRPIPKVGDATPEDIPVLGQLLWAAAEVARRLGLDEHGYRLVINNGEGAGQTVFHVHVHLLGGRELTWPPG